MCPNLIDPPVLTPEIEEAIWKQLETNSIPSLIKDPTVWRFVYPHWYGYYDLSMDSPPDYFNTIVNFLLLVLEYYSQESEGG